jgi:hypothetical protein
MYAIVSVLIAAAVGYVVASSISDSPRVQGFAIRSTSLPLLTLPTSDGGDTPQLQFSLGAIDGAVVVGSTYDDSVCGIQTLAPSTLRTVRTFQTSCDNPESAGEPVIPVESTDRANPSYGFVRISVRNRVGDGFHVGPVIMTYGDYSDTRPEWTYGGGYLWIYDAAAAKNAEVLRISEATGAVLSKVAMPDTERVDLAADADGLWVGMTIESGWPVGTTPSAFHLVTFVGVHTSREIGVMAIPALSGGAAVEWLAASGHTAWADIARGPGQRNQSLEIFPSPDVHANRIDAVRGPEPTDFGEGSTDLPPVVETPHNGLVAILPGLLANANDTSTSTESIVELNASNGGRRTLVEVHRRQPANLVADLFSHGALYLLLKPIAGSPIVVRVQM